MAHLFRFSLLSSLHGFPSHRHTPRLAIHIPSESKRRSPLVRLGFEVPLQLVVGLEGFGADEAEGPALSVCLLEVLLQVARVREGLSAPYLLGNVVLHPSRGGRVAA